MKAWSMKGRPVRSNAAPDDIEITLKLYDSCEHGVKLAREEQTIASLRNKMMEKWGTTQNTNSYILSGKKTASDIEK